MWQRWEKKVKLTFFPKDFCSYLERSGCISPEDGVREPVPHLDPGVDDDAVCGANRLPRRIIHFWSGGFERVEP